MTEILIREIEDADIAQVSELWHAAGISRPWNDPAADIGFARRGSHSTVLIAVQDAGIVATVIGG